MKLRRRRKKRRRSTAITCSAVTRLGQSPLPFPFSPPPTSFPSSSPPTHPHQPTSSVAPACQPPRVGEQLPQLSLPSCPAPPFLLHKITETAERGEKDRGGAPSLPTQLFYLTITGRAQLAAPLPLHPIGLLPLLSGSNGILSVAGGAIGKQSMKMNYPVSSPSLTNK